MNLPIDLSNLLYSLRNWEIKGIKCIHNQTIFCAQYQALPLIAEDRGTQGGEHFVVPAWSKQTYSYAAEAAEFGAVRAETSIPQFLHADEAAKHLGDALHRNRRETTSVT